MRLNDDRCQLNGNQRLMYADKRLHIDQRIKLKETDGERRGKNI